MIKSIYYLYFVDLSLQIQYQLKIKLSSVGLMRIRVQLIQNSPLHKIPTILLNINHNQYMFNLIPTLLRHRKNHQINFINNTNIFFTKHSIQTLGGLPNLILYTYKADLGNSAFSPIFNIYCDNSIYNYLEKLRFKLGYKILKISYCNWIGKKYRFGITNRALLQKLQKQPDFPHYFSNIQQKLSKKYTKKDYYDSKYFIKNEPLKQISKKIFYFSDKNVSIIPLSKSQSNQQQKCVSYICIPHELKKNEHIDVIQFMNKTSITDDSMIKQFQKTGFIKTKDDKTYKKEQFLLKQNFKPKNMLILHYNNEESLWRLNNNEILNDYLQNKNETGLIIHIVEDINLTFSNKFKQFMKRFGKDVKHLWYNNNCIVYQNNIIQNQFHLIYNNIWQKVLPSFLVDIFNNRLTYNNNQQQKIMEKWFPFSMSIFYRKMYGVMIKKHQIMQFPLNKSVICTEEENILRFLLTKYEKQLLSLNTKLYPNNNNQEFKPKILFLGTASGFPTTHRNTMGILLSVNKDLNILLDCGEGTYEQMVDHFPRQSFEIQLLNTRILFITHIHPDHNLGILNLISERKKLMAKYNSKNKIFLIIPFNVFNWYIEYNKTVQDLSQCCDVLFTQLVKHRNDSNSLAEILRVFQMKNTFYSSVSPVSSDLSSGSLKADSSVNKSKSFFNKQIKQKCQKYKKQQFEVSKKSKQLIAKELSDNYQRNMTSFEKILHQNKVKEFQPVGVIHCPQSYGIFIQNDQFKVSYSGDTRPSQVFKEKAKNSTLMIHQATFNDSQIELAQEALHSTVLQAINIGKQSRSNKTVLTHFGQKIKQNPLQKQYNKQVLSYYKNNVIYSFDHLSIDFKNMSSLPEITQFMMKIQGQKQKLLMKNSDKFQQNDIE